MKKATKKADNISMFSLLPILMAVIGIAVVILAAMLILGRTKGDLSVGPGKRIRGRDAIIKDATKRLNQNPRDPQALKAMGEIYYQEENWADAMKTYETLTGAIGGTDKEEEFEASMRYGLAANKLNMQNEAHRGLTAARAIRQNNFEVNCTLGYLEFQRKNYEKAIQLLDQARRLNPESTMALRYLGHSLFRLKKAKEAMVYIRKAIDLAPDDKESIYTLAECYYEANQIDHALKLFGHMRADPVMGPSACLLSGTIKMEIHQTDMAIQDFEIGLRHQNIKADILVDLRYRLAQAYLSKNDIARAMPLLQLIQTDTPGYKDVAVLIGKYQEMNANRNLQIYLMAPSADFVALCRKIVMTYFPRAKVKITNIQVNKNDWADIQAEVDTPKWSDLIMFRFIRTPGSIGELIVRDFHSHLKDVKAGKGVCITVGAFSEEAKRYTEARLIDLIEKEKLTAMLNTVDAKAAAATAPKKGRPAGR